MKKNVSGLIILAYIVRPYHKTTVQSVDLKEGESIETKVERILSNKEPIKDGAPELYTERKDGVLASTNIRTDRWELATDAMDKVSANIQAKRDEAMKSKEETKVIDMTKGKDGGAEPAAGGESGSK